MKGAGASVAAIVVALVAAQSCAGTSGGNAASDLPPALTPTEAAADGSIVVDVDEPGLAFDRRLLGTNAPAWISPARMTDPNFHERLDELGTTVVRMPGGSWSNGYNWLGCENADPSTCGATWASRPSDFLALLAATGIEGMWTVSFNGTAEEAAALVAFFNGSIDDTRLIGVDRRGQDWGTVGQWAALRAEHGHPDPQPIRLWEVGNEVFGAKPQAGPDSASFGWEDVWTCDGTAYVEGDADHDGYLRFREAMLMVDPKISVGAVGIGGPQGEWGNFGNEVIAAAGDAMDFYIVHDYGFNSAPPADDVLRRPQDAWPDIIDDARSTLDERDSDSNGEAETPIAVTEYNLFAFQDGDTDGFMAEAINAIYIADTIGQMAVHGVSLANQWNLINGLTPAGSDYGIFDPDTLEPRPQFYALSLWSGFGETMLPTDVGFDEGTTLTAYAARSTDGAITLLVINKSAHAIDVELHLRDATTPMRMTAAVMSAASLTAREVTYEATSATLAGVVDEVGSATFNPYSVSLVTLTPEPAA